MKQFAVFVGSAAFRSEGATSDVTLRTGLPRREAATGAKRPQNRASSSKGVDRWFIVDVCMCFIEVSFYEQSLKGLLMCAKKKEIFWS
jgi:hypothetical protein